MLTKEGAINEPPTVSILEAPNKEKLEVIIDSKVFIDVSEAISNF